MPNPHGTPIWYELLIPDPEAASAFYGAVLPWTVEAQPSGELDYRMIATSSGLLGGVMRLTAEMARGGAHPGWLVYMGVDDVDESVAVLRSSGGRTLIEPWHVPGVGRIALVTDRQGAPFYLMRRARDETSMAFDPDTDGKAGWNELTTPDQESAHDFYGRLFGWRFDERLAMGDAGEYVFIDSPRGRLGATMTTPHPEMPPRWLPYFRVADIDQAAVAVKAGGGAVRVGPMTVPTGQRVVVAGDQQGAAFGLVTG